MRFPTTRWSLVVQAANGLNEEQRLALDDLLGLYWPVLQARLVVRRQIAASEADDLVQGFLTSEVLGRDLLKIADKDRGKLRSLLCHSLDNYVWKQRRSQNAKKRAADRAEPIHDSMSAQTPRPESMLDAAWARKILATAICETEYQCEQTGRNDLWEVLDARVVRPTLDGEEPVPYPQLVEQLAFDDVRTAQNALVSAKRVFCRTMKTVLQRNGVSESEIDAEIHSLQESLAIQL